MLTGRKFAIGDAVARVAQPIARGIDYVFGTDIKNCQRCSKRQDTLNSLGDAIYDYLWQGGCSDPEHMKQFIITETRQYAVKAENMDEAEAKMNAGEAVGVGRTRQIAERPERPAQPASRPKTASTGALEGQT